MFQYPSKHSLFHCCKHYGIFIENTFVMCRQMGVSHKQVCQADRSRSPLTNGSPRQTHCPGARGRAGTATGHLAKSASRGTTHPCCVADFCSPCPLSRLLERCSATETPNVLTHRVIGSKTTPIVAASESKFRFPFHLKTCSTSTMLPVNKYFLMYGW